MNNSCLTSRIQIERGIRQGCPISLLLYITAAEILANHIRENKRIQGIYIPQIGNEKLKTSQYADDIVTLTRDPYQLMKFLVNSKNLNKLQVAD